MGRQRLEALDGMRGVAALAVLLHHCTLVTGVQLLPGGFLSVDLFFVLSGFVIALSYESRLRDGLPMSGFLIARARRLLPVHFVAIVIVTLSVLAVRAVGGGGMPVPAILSVAALNAFMIPDVKLADPFAINPALWSLWAEWMVSIIFAAALFGMRTRIIALVAVSSCAVFAALVFQDQIDWRVGVMRGNPGPGAFRALTGFCAGMLIFRCSAAIASLPPVNPKFLYAGWVLVCALPASGSERALEAAIAVVLAPLMVALLVRAERPVGSMFRWLGAISYPLYVSHLAVLIVIGVVVKHLGLDPSALYAIPVVVLALGLAEVVRRLSEIRVAPALARFRTSKEPV